MERHINNKHMETQTNQTKTKLSLQGPQWSRHSVARVRRRGDWVHSQILDVGILEKSRKIGRQGIIVFYSWKNGMGEAT